MHPELELPLSTCGGGRLSLPVGLSSRVIGNADILALPLTSLEKQSQSLWLLFLQGLALSTQGGLSRSHQAGKYTPKIGERPPEAWPWNLVGGGKNPVTGAPVTGRTRVGSTGLEQQGGLGFKCEEHWCAEPKVGQAGRGCLEDSHSPRRAGQGGQGVFIPG